MLRSDRRAETTLVANTYFQLLQEVEPQVEGELQFRDYYQYSTSKKNQRIEVQQGQIASHSINRQRDGFEALEALGEYNLYALANRIAFVTVYIPILQQEALEFTKLQNLYSIRKQNNQLHYVLGILYVLYRYPKETSTTQFSASVELEDVRLEQLREDLQGFSNYSQLTHIGNYIDCLLYTSPSPRDGLLSRMPSSA